MASVLSFLSLLAGVLALVFAEFGAPLWVFVLLFAWLLTLGLPTLAAVLMLASVWPGPSFGAFVAVAMVLAFGFQFTALWIMRRGLARRRTA